MATPTDQGFIEAFPEFNDPTRYPGTQRAFWLNIATTNFDPIRWADYLELGTYLYVAHHLTLFRDNQRSARRGAVPGRGTSGLVSSKSVGGVSVSYDTGAVTYKDAGHWNMTTYGMQWVDLARKVGMGGTQVGYGPIPPMMGIGFIGPGGYGV